MRILMKIFLLLLTCAGCTKTTDHKRIDACGQSLSHDKVINLVADDLKIAVDTTKYTFDVSENDCNYYVTVYLNGGPPDSHVFLVVGRDGKIKEKIFGG